VIQAGGGFEAIAVETLISEAVRTAVFRRCISYSLVDFIDWFSVGAASAANVFSPGNQPNRG
jgi:hypothetical protein